MHAKKQIVREHRNVIAGRDLYLRELKKSDVNRNYCSWLNDSQTNQYLESRFEKWSIEKQRNYVNKIRCDPNYLFLAIISKNGNRHIGNIKIGPINRIHRFADVSIIIGEKSLWGKGFAAQAIELVVDVAFSRLKLHKLTAGAYSNNIGSIKAFQKAGFSIEGIRKKQYFYDGTYVDGILLGIVRK